MMYETALLQLIQSELISNNIETVLLPNVSFGILIWTWSVYVPALYILAMSL